MSIIWHEADRSAGISLDGAWEVLDRFGLALQQCEDAEQQIPLVLQAVRESLTADVVFWHPGCARGDAFAQVGLSLSADWARAFIGRLHAETGDTDQVVLQFLDPGAKPMTPWPCSAVLTQISRMHGSYLAALSFHPRRLFGQTDLGVMKLARRMLLNQRQQTKPPENLHDSQLGLVRCLAAAADARADWSWGHSERVARVAVRLGQQMGLPPAVLDDLNLAALLHDVGNILIRESVLQQPERLTDEEYGHIKQHALIGDRLVANLRPVQHLRTAVRSHHERWDGKGYPDGLAGEGIPLLARILAVADSCEAMLAGRPYRSALPPTRIDAALFAGAGEQWDPDVVAQFMTCRRELYSLCERGSGESLFVALDACDRSGRRDKGITPLPAPAG